MVNPIENSLENAPLYICQALVNLPLKGNLEEGNSLQLQTVSWESSTTHSSCSQIGGIGLEEGLRSQGTAPIDPPYRGEVSGIS